MKIVVLAGGLSTERQVALTSGTGVCKALRQRGHKAILVDMFLGLESYDGALEDIFDAPDGLCGQSRVESVAPDLEAVRRSRRDQSPSHAGAGRADRVPHGGRGISGAARQPAARTDAFRPRWICWVCRTPVPAIWAAAWPWISP